MQDPFAELLEQECIVKYNGKAYPLKHPSEKDSNKVEEEWSNVQDNKKIKDQLAHQRKLKVYSRALSACTNLSIRDARKAIIRLRDGSSFATPVETKAAQLCGLPVVDVSKFFDEKKLMETVKKKIEENPEADHEDISSEAMDEIMKDSTEKAVEEAKRVAETNEAPLS